MIVVSLLSECTLGIVKLSVFITGRGQDDARQHDQAEQRGSQYIKSATKGHQRADAEEREDHKQVEVIFMYA